MKRLSVVLLTLLFAGAVSLGERYADAELGFTMRGPAGWQIRPQPAEQVSVVFLGPTHDGFTSNLNVVVIGEIIETTVQGLGRVARDLDQRMEKMEGIRDYLIVRSGITPVGGVRAIYIESAFEREVSGEVQRFKQLQTLIPGPGGHSIITYTARSEIFESAVADAQAAMNSFTAPLESPGGGPPGWRGVFLALGAAALGGLTLAWWSRRRREGET
ncbi:MAG: hypothetical protein Q8R92_02770 [Deltaproteobacteria bacterium]|nr:hypothetical protein [Deltaproteobacteria bacterium]